MKIAIEFGDGGQAMFQFGFLDIIYLARTEMRAGHMLILSI